MSSLRIWQVDAPGPTQVFDAWHAVAQVIDRALPAGAPKGGSDDLRSQSSEPANDGGVRTVVEAVTLLIQGEEEDGVSDAFDRCFGSLLELLSAYRTTTQHLLPTVTFERLPPVVLWVRGAADGSWWDQHQGLLVLHHNVPVTLDELSGEDAQAVADHLAASRQRHPALPYMQHRLDALVELEREGRLAACVVQAHVAFEVFSDSMVSLTLWESGWGPEKAARYFSATRSAHQRLSGTGSRLLKPWWDRRHAPERLKEWYSTATRLRHRVVHAGYEPTRDAARKVLGALDVCVAVCLTAVLDGSTDLPTTAYLLAGRDQLMAHGNTSPQLRDWLSDLDEATVLGAFAAWREELDLQRWETTT